MKVAQGCVSSDQEKDVVVHTIVWNDDGHILLHERRGTGIMDGFYSFPGGHIQVGEEIEDAAIREVLEETGIEVHRVEPVVIMPYEGGMDHIFQTFDWQGEPRICEPEKCSAMGWFSPFDLPDNVVPFAEEAVGHSLGLA